MRRSRAIIMNTSVHDTVSWLAGIIRASHALARDHHRSREFIEQLLDAAYSAHTAIKVILDNHSAHISKETQTQLLYLRRL
jgi:hypothetical protein